ncbi:hypothetical protein [Pararhodobacter zhoushanensis]|uniref:hypothetical protein n=1 Tax=Pararhodobacter zhoushanensis TaxID=2479545 RepID=UPI000F8EF940|nr:hypothetical protein [Pararhodobacter zhoushanensis]
MPLAPLATRVSRVLASALVLTAGLGLPAFAQDLHADWSSFNVFNDSSRPMIAYAVQLSSGHYTANQLAGPMQPGIGLTLNLQGMLDDACDHATRIVWDDGTPQDLMVPYCTLAAVTLTDKGVAFE